MPNPTVVEQDPWLDNEFGSVDFRSHKEDLMDDLVEIANETGLVDPPAEVIVTPPAEPATPVVNEPPPPPAPAEDEPQVISNPDGSSISIEKSSKGWKATLDTGTGAAPEIFYGKTKNELLTNVAVGKMNATKKIRQLNREVKLGGTPTTPAPNTVAPTTAARELTADEVFEIKTQLETNPDLAMENWFQKKTGLNLNQLVSLAKAGQKANQVLSTEEVNKRFVQQHPDFYADPNYENFASLVAYLMKHKIGKAMTDANKDAGYQQLVDDGHWTVQNLDEAYTELSDSGLLVLAPRAPAVPEPPPAPPVQPAAPSERIVRTETRPRAGLGIRTSEVSPTRAPEPPPPSAEDLDSLSDEQIAQLMRDASRLRRTSQR